MRAEDYTANRPVRSSTKIIKKRLFEGHCGCAFHGKEEPSLPAVTFGREWSRLMTWEEALVLEVMEG